MFPGKGTTKGRWNTSTTNSRPGSIIYSDEWGANNQLQATLGLRHQTVNHSLHFVGPVTGAHPRNCGNVELVQTNDARKELLVSI